MTVSALPNRPVETCMYVDPRVANAHAKKALKFITTDPSVLHRKIATALASVVHTGTMSNRDFRRRLEKKVLPALTRLGVIATVIQNDGYAVLTCYALCGNETAGAIELIISLDCRELRISQLEATVVTQHAVARCLQRNGVTDFSDIEFELWEALKLAEMVGDAAANRDWLQVGVPTSKGLFVGTFDGTTVTLHTYLQPGKNGRPSRWDPFLALVGTVPSLQPDPASLQRFAGWVKGFAPLIYEDPRVDAAAPFLKTPYTRGEDPLDAAWAVAPRETNPQAL